MKICLDCKYHKSRNCFHPSLGVDLVDGTEKSQLCAIMRLDFQPCKPNGLLFESAEPVVYDLAALFPDVKLPNLVRTNNE